MRPKKEQYELDTMKEDEKIKRTSFYKCKEKGIVIKDFGSWFLALNEYPHYDRKLPQYVLRHTIPQTNMVSYSEDFADAVEYIDNHLGTDYRITRHALDEKSVRYREHRHIFSIKNKKKGQKFFSWIIRILKQKIWPG